MQASGRKRVLGCAYGRTAREGAPAPLPLVRLTDAGA
jgi:hypothetical protein